MLIFLSHKPINGYQCYIITLRRETRKTVSREKISHGNKLVSGQIPNFICKVCCESYRTTYRRYVLVLFVITFSVT